MSSTRVLLSCLLVVLLAVTVVGCGPKDAPAPPSPSGDKGQTTPTTPEPAVDRELVVGHHLDPTTLNPSDTTTAAFQSVYAQICEQLVTFSPDGAEILPWLATSWEWIDDVTLEMDLRQGVSFTNGEPFDAVSAAFSIDQFAESPRYAWLVPPDVYKETEVINDHKIRIHLHRPFAPFLGFLARGGATFPPIYYAEKGIEGFGQEPIGTGPFMLTEWVKDSHLVLERNPDYWNGPHPLKKVTYRVIPEETSRIAALETGEIDIALMVPVSAISRLERNDNVQVVTSPGLRKFAVHFDTRFAGSSPLDDPRVRTAMNMAVDKEMIAAQIFEGQADPLQGQWQVETEAGHNPNIKMFPYDPEAAKQLLADAGYPDGFDLKFTYTVGRYANDKELGEAVSSYLEQIGIRVQQEALEYGAYIELWRAKTCGTHQWGLAIPTDPYFNYSLFVDGTIYEFHHLGPEFTDKVIELSKTTELAKRQELSNELAQTMFDDPPMLYLVVPRDVYAIGNNVTGFVPRSDQVLWLFDVNLSD